MALFVDLDDEAEPPHPDQYHHDHRLHGALKPTWTPVEKPVRLPTPPASDHPTPPPCDTSSENEGHDDAVDQKTESEDVVKTRMAEALRCYPVAMAIAASLDLNALDNLSRTCRPVRLALLQYRSSLVAHTMHCANEDIPVDPEETFRYRARAGNWFYMEDVAHASSDYNGKSGSCARDMVAECRRCSQIVCRNCAIKPPAPAVFKGRHRRLCIPCTKAPLATLTKPPLLPGTAIDSDIMQRAICTCAKEGVWLCQPCGRGIRGADQDYHSIWKWRNQYGEVLGGVGTGIGEGDRGVICGREGACCSSKEREQETDCDAEDARHEQEMVQQSLFPSGSGTPQTPPVPVGGAGTPGFFDTANTHTAELTGTTPPGLLHPAMAGDQAATPGGSTRTPSPPHAHFRPGYARHEIEGIGGRVKTKLLRTVKVGACVAEWEDERHNGKILGRELSGRSRSWCGWCWRVIPGANEDTRHHN